MVSNAEVLEYIASRKAVYEGHESTMRLRQVAEPTRSARYAVLIAMDKAAVMTLEHIAHYVEHGEPHPDLVAPVLSEAEPEAAPEKEEVASEPEAEAKPARRGGRPRKAAGT